MSIKERAKKIWREHKGVICVVTGVTFGVATFILLNRRLEVSIPGAQTLVPVEDLSFPVEMPIAEIKKVVQNEEGIRYIKDALLVGRETGNRMYVRDAVL